MFPNFQILIPATTSISFRYGWSGSYHRNNFRISNPVVLASNPFVDNASYILVDTYIEERIDKTVDVSHVYYNGEKCCLACFSLSWPVVTRQEYTKEGAPTDEECQWNGTYDFCYTSCTLLNKWFDLSNFILFRPYLMMFSQFLDSSWIAWKG